jgi:TetR/AcrR family transcriptional regulator, tetracycline repressor protein
VTPAERPRLTKAAVVQRALALADADGPEALTIRRLADQLGVTPMAIYWHFRNKDELLSAVADHVMSEVRPDREPDAPWHEQLRSMVEALVRVIRRHPSGPAVLFAGEKNQIPGMVRATEAALGLLRTAGFTLAEAYQIAGYLLHNSISLVEHEPGRLPGMSPEEAAECQRRDRLVMQALPRAEFPNVVEYASEPDPTALEKHYTFGVDLMMGGIQALAATRKPSGRRHAAARR